MLPNRGITGLKHLSHYVDSDGSDGDDKTPPIGEDKVESQNHVKTSGNQSKNNGLLLQTELASNSTENVSETDLSPYRNFFNDIELPPLPSVNGLTETDKLNESKRLKDRLVSNMEKANRGLNIIEHIRNSRAFKNPSIYEKLLKYCSLVEYSSNYDNSIFNPLKLNENEGNYKILADRQMRDFQAKKQAQEKARKTNESSNAKEKRRKEPKRSSHGRYHKSRSRSPSRGRKRKDR